MLWIMYEFIRFSGADPDKYSKDSQKKVDEVIKRISKLLKKKVKSSVDVQNTAKLLQELQPTTADFSFVGTRQWCRNLKFKKHLTPQQEEGNMESLILKMNTIMKCK